ncbi:hypothetical protein SKAU_G00426490 [Synaphobranchus kaupii]|uniref:Uncharacterized protein n=1 Tax=Synaphobranchus kaupii TaxID=118154 RepID=A0A9Q1IAB2_SYNKA|nr:hypothetical protein SKAU_G00426490 [Synaphobranchus kaupii]
MAADQRQNATIGMEKDTGECKTDDSMATNYDKYLTMSVEIVGEDKVTMMELLSGIKEVCGKVTGCRFKSPGKYEVTLSHEKVPRFDSIVREELELASTPDKETAGEEESGESDVEEPEEAAESEEEDITDSLDTAVAAMGPTQVEDESASKKEGREASQIPQSAEVEKTTLATVPETSRVSQEGPDAEDGSDAAPAKTVDNGGYKSLFSKSSSEMSGDDEALAALAIIKRQRSSPSEVRVPRFDSIVREELELASTPDKETAGEEESGESDVEEPEEAAESEEEDITDSLDTAVAAMGPTQVEDESASKKEGREASQIPQSAEVEKTTLATVPETSRVSQEGPDAEDGSDAAPAKTVDNGGYKSLFSKSSSEMSGDDEALAALAIIKRQRSSPSEVRGKRTKKKKT